MRVAIFHNYMDNIGGAEITALTLARELKADVYTTNLDADKIEHAGFSDVAIREISRVPVRAPYKQQATLARFLALHLPGAYDFFVIDGDWAMSAALRNRPNLWYVHSPIREIYDLYEYTRGNQNNFVRRAIFDLWVALNRIINRRLFRYVDRVVCNSENTRKRVRRYLRGSSEVVYPPVDTKEFHYRRNGDFWLSVNRLFEHKRVELQCEAFASLPSERLVVVGSHEETRHSTEYARHLNQTKPPNVEMAGWVDPEELTGLYADCKAFITTSYEEDFGLTPVEAMASGKPVIAPNEGGYRESVIDGVTGILIDKMTAGSLASAVTILGPVAGRYKGACLERAQKFDKEVFARGIRRCMEACLSVRAARK
ncbi:glycosyltransferase [Thermodesulfobacteriota bacterium]